MATFTVLDQADEDKLHATRLLGIEERPYKRLTKRLLGPSTPIHSYLTRPLEPTESATVPTTEQYLADISRFRDDVLLDFAAFTSSIARIQFLRASNVRERERYAAEKLKIEVTAQEVRENLTELRAKLEDAQETLRIRKGYDVLAEGIQKAGLKSREEQEVAIEKLKAEIEELKGESGELDNVWVERREQVGRVVGEAMRLRRLIRDEKEPEPEDQGDKEDGDEDGQSDGDEDGMGGGEDRDGLSHVGTPRLEDDLGTPLPTNRGSGIPTPRDGSILTPLPAVNQDVEMAEEASVAGTTPNIGPRIGEEMDTT